jgi:hypothetical protein
MTAATDHRTLISKIVAELAREPQLSEAERIAIGIGALPVYEDMGGCIALTPDREILEIDCERGTWSIEEDPRWRRLALKRAATRFPALTELLPVRPEDAAHCDACSGSGVLFGVACARCASLGWYLESDDL